MPSDGARCPTHRRAHQRRRPTATQRGYGPAHRAARAELRDTLPALCGYGCGRLLMPDGDWVAAHRIDGDPSAGWLASCRTCNERAKARVAPRR